MTRHLLITPLLLLPLLAAAQVYKSLDADGRPVYTDRPIENSTKLDVPLVRATEPLASPSPTADTVNEAGFRGAYSSFEILSPEDSAILTNPEREVQLSLLLTPPLQPAHRLRVQVDGVAVEGDLGKRTQIRLTGLALGSHRIQAQVVDADDIIVAATALLNLHIRPPGADGDSP